MGDTATATAIATILSAGIAAAVGIITQRSAARASVVNAATVSRTDIEREAFDRAKSYYTDTIDRQATELRELEAEAEALRQRIASLEGDRAADHRAIRELREELEYREEKIRALTRRLLDND